jgi:mono/diheme cytochrome c family protein
MSPLSLPSSTLDASPPPHTLRALSLAALALPALAVALFTLTACHSLPPSKPLAELTPTEQSGYRIYQSRCASCHYPNSQRSLHGPGLQGIFKLPYLPSGAPANDDSVRNVILRGRNSMPAFSNDLTPPQITDLLAYLHTL